MTKQDKITKSSKQKQRKGHKEKLSYTAKWVVGSKNEGIALRAVHLQFHHSSVK